MCYSYIWLILNVIYIISSVWFRFRPVVLKRLFPMGRQCIMNIYTYHMKENPFHKRSKEDVLRIIDY